MRVTVSTAGETVDVDYGTAARVTLIGSSTELAFPIAVPSMGAHRHYFQPGDMAGTGTGPRWGVGDETKLSDAYTRYGVRDFSVSFKDFGLTKARAFFASAPADVRFWCTAFHEHNGDITRDGTLTYAAYTALCHQVADAAHEAGHLFGPIHNGMNRQNGTTGTWGYWPNEWQRVEAPLAKCDFWGMDTYAKAYEDPVPTLAPAVTYAASLGLPMLIGETASYTTDPTKQALYATRFRAWALNPANNVALACWWNNTWTPPYKMLDQTCRNWFNI